MKQSRTSLDEQHTPDHDYPAGLFGPEHGLTPQQAWLAGRILAERQRAYPLHGYRRVMRMGGIVSAIKGGRVGSSAWGRSMLARQGGQALAAHNPLHLVRISRAGVLARQGVEEVAPRPLRQPRRYDPHESDNGLDRGRLLY